MQRHSSANEPVYLFAVKSNFPQFFLSRYGGGSNLEAHIIKVHHFTLMIKENLPCPSQACPDSKSAFSLIDLYNHLIAEHGISMSGRRGTAHTGQRPLLRTLDDLIFQPKAKTVGKGKAKIPSTFKKTIQSEDEPETPRPNTPVPLKKRTKEQASPGYRLREVGPIFVDLESCFDSTNVGRQRTTQETGD